MRRGRWLRRGVAGLVVLAAGALALAAPGPTGVDVAPTVLPILQSLNSGGSGIVEVSNMGGALATITAINPDGTCPGGITAAPFMANLPLDIETGGSAELLGVCSGTSAYGIRRCQQHVMQGPTPATSFTMLCITRSAQQLTTTSSTIALPDAQVNTVGAPQEIVVTNPVGNPSLSGLFLQIADQEGDFTLQAPCPQNGLGCDLPSVMMVPPGGTFSVFVSCSPKSLGPHSAPLHMVGSAGPHGVVTLTCNGTTGTSGPAILTDKTTVALSLQVGAGSASSNINVRNNGDATLSVTGFGLTGSTDWTYDAQGCMGGCMLAPGSAFDLTAVFTPTALGSRDATLVINSNDPANPMLAIALEGTGLGAVLAPGMGLGTPPMIDLGDVPIGVELGTTFTLRNDGNVELDPVTLTTSGVFGASPTSASIAASSSATFMATCTPTAEQVYTGTIEAEALEAIAGSPLEIGVRCRGTTSSFYAVPSSIDLGEVRVGEPTMRMIELRAVGSATPTITVPPTLAMHPAMTVTAAAPITFSSATPASFALEIDPTVDTDLANTIRIVADGDEIAIPVTGRVVTPDVAAPETLMLGSFCVGQSTQATPTALTASGTASIHLPVQPVMTQGASSPFQVTYASPVAYPYDLPAGADATVEVTPLRQMTAGTRTDRLVWTTDSPGEEEVATEISAEFIAVGGAIAPQFVDFGSVMLQTPAPTRTVRIQNCGADPIELSTIAIEPGGEFRADVALPLTLAQNQTATITVGFVPRRSGSRTAVLTITSSRGPLNVTLSGNGVGDDTTRSFYACDCTTSDPAGAWPALLVVLVLRRRRRR